MASIRVMDGWTVDNRLAGISGLAMTTMTIHRECARSVDTCMLRMNTLVAQSCEH